VDRAAAIASALVAYARTAWWGLVAPRIHEERPLVVVQAVVLREAGDSQHILLSVRSDLLGWELPGGTIERDEPVEAALVREVREETGLEVEPIRHVGDYVRTGFRPHTACVYVCRATGGHLQPSAEAPVVRWFDVRNLPDTLFPWYRDPISDAFVDRTDPVRRQEHQGLGSIWAGMRIDLAMRWRGAIDRDA